MNTEAEESKSDLSSIDDQLANLQNLETPGCDESDPIYPFYKFSKEAQELYWPSTIHRIKCPSPIQFYRDYVATNTPVVITGMLDEWPARKKWNLDYLRSYGGEVSIDITPAGLGDCVVNDRYFVQPDQTKMPFSEFVDLISGEKRGIGVYYMQKQNDNFRVEFRNSPLWGDVLGNVQNWASDVFGEEPEAINMWMGNDDAFSSLHKDHYENIYCVVRGQKNFTLLPPTDILYLHQREYIPAHYKYNSEISNWGIDLDESDALIPWIPCNPDCLGDYLTWPKLKYTSPLHVEVKAGEVLYLPSLNYHQVGQKAGSDGSTIAINYWYDMKYDVKFNLYKLFEGLGKKMP